MVYPFIFSTINTFQVNTSVIRKGYQVITSSDCAVSGRYTNLILQIGYASAHVDRLFEDGEVTCNRVYETPDCCRDYLTEDEDKSHYIYQHNINRYPQEFFLKIQSKSAKRQQDTEMNLSFIQVWVGA